MDHQSRVHRSDLENMVLDESVQPMDLPLQLLEDITGGFSCDQEIGRGGFAVVYKGTLENGAVAVKKLINTHIHENEFQQEARCLMKAKHQNIVRFLGYCSNTQGKMVDYNGKLVMADVQERLLCFEYLPRSLDVHITDASNRLEWTKLYKIIKGICEGLHYLHENKIVHRDIKPSNILLDDNMVPKIADFGLSRCFDENQSRAVTSKLIGSMGYMAPEFYSGEITLKSDIYSLGVIITEILTGKKGYAEIDNVLESWKNMAGISPGNKELEQIRVCAEIGLESIESNPRRRPTTELILDRLHQMESTILSTEASENSTSVMTQPECYISEGYRPSASTAEKPNDEPLFGFNLINHTRSSATADKTTVAVGQTLMRTAGSFEDSGQLSAISRVTKDHISSSSICQSSAVIWSSLKDINSQMPFAELWRACAGPLVELPQTNERVFYFLQGHLEQLQLQEPTDTALLAEQIKMFQVPNKILCKVVDVELKAETETDDMYAQITLQPEPDQVDLPTLPDPPLPETSRPVVHSFCRILTPSDTSIHGGFCVLRRHANECLPPLDMSMPTPTQELITKDLHGSEWRFKHIYRGQPRRHLLTTGWRTFVTSKKLIAGDAFVYLRSETGEQRVGVRRLVQKQGTMPASVISSQSMHLGVLATASHAIKTNSVFLVYYRPRLSQSQYIVSLNKYLESSKIGFNVGMRFKMSFEGEDVPVKKFSGTVVDKADISPQWQGSEWKTLKVKWDEATNFHGPERVSSWEIEPFNASAPLMM